MSENYEGPAFAGGVFVGALVLWLIVWLLDGFDEGGARAICRQVGYPRVAYVESKWVCEKEPERMTPSPAHDGSR